MKRLVIAPIIGTLTLAVASPAVAQAKPAFDQGVSIQLVMTRDPAADRESYVQQARNETAVWRQKLDDLGTKMKSNSSAAEAQAAQDLDNAWSKTKAASSRLETAGAEDWSSAKASFKRASHNLAMAWQKAAPQQGK